ncbi:MAG: 50S ribosomal protein L24 [Flavobacteriales bacterium]|nr:50S ribosomal protein L24 [Flavobacteriales bacterium]
MSVKVKIRKGDQVQVIAGSAKGSKGEITQVIKEKNRAVVGGVNMIKKHVKPNAQNPQGGIVEVEAPIHISNLAIVDPKSGKPTRVGYKFDGDKKIRIAKDSGESI